MHSYQHHQQQRQQQHFSTAICRGGNGSTNRGSSSVGRICWMITMSTLLYISCCFSTSTTIAAFTNAAIYYNSHIPTSSLSRGGYTASTTFDSVSNHDIVDDGTIRYTTITTQHNAATSAAPYIAVNNDASDNNKSENDPSKSKEPLKVLFLSADTGGGHRASAESLANQFLLHYPGSKYDLLDIWTTDGIKPYNTLVKAYKHLSAHPRQWRFLYHLSNSRPWEIGMDIHSTWTCEKRIRNRIASYDPDVVVSVHPAMNYAPLVSLKKINRQTGKHIPFFTVVTDLGSGHCTWFHKAVDKMFVASDRIRRLAKRRGGTPDNKIVMTGLPIRNDFAVQSKIMGDRTSEHGKKYQLQMKQQLLKDHPNCNPNDPMILVMGGGEGVGSLSTIVDELYTSCSKRNVNATIFVVCGRNEKLQNQLSGRDWSSLANRQQKIRLKSRLPFIGERKRVVAIHRALRRSTSSTKHEQKVLGRINVIGLGFVTNMADYMVGADVLVTKAGPGTIAEAAAVGLPIMLTSFLPGQEAGNVDYVLENNFGDYSEDPVSIAEQVTTWLQDPSILESMSHKAQAAGRPDAASEIVLAIGSETHAWKALNSRSSSSSKGGMTIMSH